MSVLDTFPDFGSNAIETLSFFTGIAGFELGLHDQGHRPVMFCEIEPAAQDILRAWMPDVPLYEDVRLMDQLPVHGKLLAAGWPCTNLTQVGKTEGIFGPQSGLVREIFRMLKEKPIDTILLENVVNLLHLHQGIGMEFITRELEKLHYRWAYRVVDTICTSLPHRRRRVYLAACLFADPREILLADDAGPVAGFANDSVDLEEHAVGFNWTEGNTGLGLAVDSIPPLRGGSTIGIPSAPAILCRNGFVGTPDIDDAERLQGFPAGWTVVGDEYGRGRRWQLVGNSITRDVSAWLGSRMQTPGRYDSSRDVRLQAGQRWPTAAWNMGTGAHRSFVSENPLGRPITRIEDFLSKPLKALSARATAGFLQRARRSSLRFPTGFLARLDDHLQAQLIAEGGKQFSFGF
jgi:DNA (cytosine-5)-methyltransferase 1